jgi:hypothetical protein
MGTLRVETERTVAADPSEVFGLVSDYAEGRPRYLPPNYEGYEVEEGGRGAGTTVRYVLHAARRERPYRMQVTQPDAGLTVVERTRARRSPRPGPWCPHRTGSDPRSGWPASGRAPAESAGSSSGSSRPAG